MKNIRVVFMGTPNFAVPILETLIENTNVVLVVSQPDREKDRKGNVLPTKIKEVATLHNIEVFQPQKIKENYNKILETNPDLIVTCAYGQILPQVILDCPELGCINVHGSLLPKLRGGAPIHHAIIDGEKETGITIMYMDKKMDSGDIIKQESLPIDDNDNLDSLYEKMSLLGAKLLSKTLPSIISKTNERISQDEDKVTFGLNITKEEEKIDFNNSCKKIYDHIRGLSSVPCAYCYLDGKRLKIYASEITNKSSTDIPGKIVDIDKNAIYVSTNDYQLKILEIKFEGKKRCTTKEFINGINKDKLIGKVLY